MTLWENITLLLSIISILLLVLAEILSPKYGKINLLFERNKLKNAAIIIGILALSALIILTTGI